MQSRQSCQSPAEVSPAHDRLTQGAGFLNAKGAVDLARFFAAPPGSAYPATTGWSAQLIWGNQLLTGGRVIAAVNAWATNLTWGAALTSSYQDIEFGLTLKNSHWMRWRTNCLNSSCSAVDWGSAAAQNVVWGTVCGGSDCRSIVER